jgi:hypothetical protein
MRASCWPEDAVHEGVNDSEAPPNGSRRHAEQMYNAFDRQIQAGLGGQGRGGIRVDDAKVTTGVTTA